MVSWTAGRLFLRSIRLGEKFTFMSVALVARLVQAFVRNGDAVA